MKKHLLIGFALVAAISAFPQAASKKREHTPVVSISVLMAKRFAAMKSIEERGKAPVSSNVIQPTEEPAANLRTSNTTSIGPVTWQNFTGSMNMYGYIQPGSKPLHYDDELNSVTFVHRKSNTYVPSPVPTSVGANTGVLVTMVSQNWGGSWDSTMIYNDNINWARYPQGGVLKASNLAGPSNTNIANAFIVGTAPVTPAAGGWIGSIFTSKALGPGTYNNTQASSSQTFIANSPPYTAWNSLPAKMDFVSESFTATDDGKIRAIGSINDGGNATPLRGAMLITGTYVSGAITWRTDSLIPPVRINNLTGGRFLAYPNGMAWSEDGQTGYVWFIGAHTTLAGNNTGANVGYQPIIARTNDFGGTWSWSSVDFNQTTFQAPVLDHLYATDGDPNLTVPFVWYPEGVSAVVDSARNLHLACLLIASPAAADPDSVDYINTFTNYDGEVYRYPHKPGLRPYLYDFHGNGNGNGNYSVTLVDSLSSEGPGSTSADDGFGLNPWAPDQTTGDKIDIDSRIQLSRTVDGKYILYSWAETDTIFTTNSNGYTKWNLFPNVKSRLMEARTSCLSATEINVSKLPDANNQTKMTKTSYNHYVSSKCATDLAATTTNSIVIKLPHTISFNTGLIPLNPATTRYATVPLEFERPCFAGVLAPVSTFDFPATGCVNKPLQPDNQSIGSPAPTYAWSVLPGGTALITPNTSTMTPNITFSAAGTYTVNLTATNSSGTNSSSKVITITVCDGIQNNAMLQNSIKFAPNPTSGLVNIISSSNENQNLDITIHNYLGQFISSASFKDLAANTASFDMSTYANGVYFVTLDNGHAKTVKRLILNK